MRRYIRTIDATSQFFGILAGIFIMAGVVLVVAELVVRNIFNGTLYITQEYTAYFMVATTFFGLAYTLKESGHIRLEFLYRVVQSGKSRALLEIYALLVGLILFIIITYTTTDFFLDAVASDKRSMQISKTMLAIPQFAMPLGSLLISLQFTAEIAKCILQIKTNDYGKMQEEEIDILGR
ncbi:TRAP transporter small permease subunit [Sporosarcina ureilytica]|uniref:TRAP transporter small permease protein n=1 Tax=Sporosarcina ureilytica TaxID=298596 RepID=A0A1D8JF99_9BACL|nr:TRAP transporter small permease [Sporosarcina ureilytica]AOV07387.1 TRAP transporter small permease protein [Sporosarcina ureilytica]